MSNNPSEGSQEPTYILPPSSQEPSGSQVPTYPQSSSYVPPPPPYGPSGPSMSSPYEQPNPYTIPPPPYEPPGPQAPSPRKGQKRLSGLFVFLAILAVVAVVIGSISWWALMRRESKTESPPPVTNLVPNGQVGFLDSQDKAPGVTDALKITVTGLSNPPDGSGYDAWLIDTTSEQILSLGRLSKSDPTTFELAYPNATSQSRTNLLGVGNKVEVTLEQGKVTHPTGNVVLSATFPPQALIHIRHILLEFPATPGKVGLLTGLLNETQKVNALSQMLQSNAGGSNTAAVSCIAQAIVNVIEGKNGTNYLPLAANCASVGIGDALIGDDFGILGDKGYNKTAAEHASLAASQKDATETIRQYAKEVVQSTESINAVMTKINDNALQLRANPATTTLVPEIVSSSDHAYRGFDQNGNGTIEPIVGEAGALTAYTRGQRMAALTLSEVK